MIHPKLLNKASRIGKHLKLVKSMLKYADDHYRAGYLEVYGGIFVWNVQGKQYDYHQLKAHEARTKENLRRVIDNK